MDSRIEILKKNYEERMNEFVNVLSRADCLPGSRVLDEWRFHLELTLKSSGWVAVYKPSKDRQPSPGPDFVNELVMVEKVDYHNFEACVAGMEQNNESIVSSEASSLAAKLFCVPLEDLYPCVKQPNSDLDGVEINNTIDKLRFFKQNLWLPWDEEDDSDDWRVSSLEPRMQLLYDMEQGQVSCEIAERVRRLFGQAWRAHNVLRSVELAMDEGDTASQSSHESQTQEEDEGMVIRIMQLHHRIDNIQKELERLQNPLLRNLMIREKQRTLKRIRKPELPWTRLVWTGGDMTELSKCMSETAALNIANTHFKVYPLLQMALEEASTGDTVTLAPGHYTLLGSGGLEEGGQIIGLGESKVHMSGCEAGDVMLSVRCEPVHNTMQQELPPGFKISNITLDANNLEICLLLNSGHIILENCKVDGGGSHIADSVGVMVREGAKLTARNCIFSGFYYGLVAYEGARIELFKCTIKNCVTGMQLFRGVEAEMGECVLSECSSSGVMYKWKAQDGDKQDTFVARELLNSLPGVNVHATDFHDVQIMMQRSDGDSQADSA